MKMLESPELHSSHNALNLFLFTALLLALILTIQCTDILVACQAGK